MKFSWFFAGGCAWGDTASVWHDHEFSRLNAALDCIGEPQAANTRQIALNQERI